MKNVEDIYPLSALQESLLFHVLSAPGSGVGFEQMSWVIDAALDVEAFRRAWQRVVERHPTLRTIFLSDGLARPLQVVRQRVQVPFEFEDWRGLPPPQQEQRLSSLIEDDRRQGFDITQAPLLRVRLIWLGNARYRLIFSHHHLLLDGWCIPVLFEEVSKLYASYLHGEPELLPPVRPFRDYITWLGEQDLSAAEAYWRSVLEGLTRPTRLRIERQVPNRATRGSADAQHELRWTAPASEELRSFARRHDLTLNTLVQGAWALLLARYSGSDDVVFGCAVSGRPADLAGVESILGMFINNLPVRIRVPTSAALVPWLHEIQQQLAEMRRFEYTPLLRVQEWSGLPFGLRLFETLVVFQSHAPDAEVEAALAARGLGVQGARLETGYPLTLVVEPGRLLVLRLYHDGAVYARAAAQRLLEHLAQILAAIPHGEERKISDVPLITPIELHRSRFEWSAGETAGVAEVPVQRRFWDQAERMTDATAIEWEHAALSYGCLARIVRTNVDRLRALGLPVGARIALLSRPASPEFAIGLLSILCVGGACLLPDPGLPCEGVAAALERAGAVLALAESGEPGLPLLPLELRPPGGDSSGGSLPIDEHLDDDALVVAVAGPGGRSHWREISHRSLSMRVHALDDALAAGKDIVLLAPRNAAPVRAAIDVLLPLCSGGRLVLGPELMSESTDLLRQVLDGAGATVLQAPSGVWEDGDADSWVPPRNPLELQIVQIWEELFGVSPIGVTEDFFELGGHSLLVLRLVAELRSRFGRDLPLTALLQAPTVEKIAALVSKQVPAAPDSPLVAMQPRGSRCPFFCIHPAGGTVLCYVPLSHALGSDQPFYGLEARGLRGESDVADRVETMADDYLDAIRRFKPRGPYLLGGWSFGGLVALEVAQRLLAMQEEVALLAIFDTYVGDGIERIAPDDAQLLANLLGEELPVSVEELRRQGGFEAQLDFLLEYAKRLDRLPPDFNADLARRLLRVRRGTASAWQHYRPQHYPGRVALFTAGDVDEDVQEVVRQDPTLGWSHLARELEIHEIPGRHAAMCDPPQVRVLAARLGSCLARAVGTRSQ